MHEKYEKPNTVPEKITRLLEKAVSGNIDIPELQREFVWTKEQVKDLVDSLIKGYPVGAFIIWNHSNYTTGKYAFENMIKEWIIDGQQRIISFCILSRKKPYWLDINKWNEILDKYKIKINILTREVRLENPIIKKDSEFLYTHEILNFPDVAEAAEQLSKILNRHNLFVKIYDNIKIVEEALSMEVPIIKIGGSLEDMAIIFERINSSGTKVKQANISLAYLAAYNKEWVRKDFTEYLEALEEEGFDFESTLLIRALTSVGDNKAVIKDVKEDFLKNKNGILDISFGKFKNSLNMLIQEFKNIGILSSDLIFAKNVLIPLIYIQNKFQNEFDFKKVLHYLLLALAQGRYSGSSETTLQEDINKVQNSKSFDEAIDKLHEDTIVQ